MIILLMSWAFAGLVWALVLMDRPKARIPELLRSWAFAMSLVAAVLLGIYFAAIVVRLGLGL